MKTLVTLFAVLVLGVVSAAAQQPTEEEMQAMMAKAAQFTQPGEHHDLLKRFIGRWDAELAMTMPGAAMPPGKGTMEASWLVDGRWITVETNGPLMGMPMRLISTMGYDNFKQSYVATTVSNVDTAMNRVEGDLTPDGNALILYGTIDEYLTGEHDKMVKGVFRFRSDDEIVFEVHDLPIGEENTKVFEIRYTRASESR